MSSEGSVTTSASSRIRQFGLYRTIDAKTEDFLRLSRKRQIRQGCACAVISTAITVTVVVTVILVYMEHGINTDLNQQTMSKASWIGLINDTRASSLEEKFTKSKLNFDSTSIKLIPLLIKALKQNRYLEKIIEDYSSSSPAYEGKETTEFSFKRNLILNSNNWLKKPSKLYSIEYKISPVIYFKKPSKNLAYYSKIRKIRDYNRIKGYVDKMINDKVVDHTRLMSRFDYNIHSQKLPKKLHDIPKKPIKQHNDKQLPEKLNPLRMTNRQDSNKSNIVSCKCPKQLGFLLNKIVSSIQQLFPEIKPNTTTPCPLSKNKSKTTTNLSTTTNEPTTSSTKITTTRTVIPVSSSLIQKKISYPLLFSEFSNIFEKEDKPSASLEIDNILRKEDTTLPSFNTEPTVEKQIQSEFNKFNIKEERLVSTTIKEYIEPTEAEITASSTQPMSKLVNNVEKDPFTLITSEKYINAYEKEQLNTKPLMDFTLYKTAENPTTMETVNKIRHPLYDINNDDDDLNTTTGTDETNIFSRNDSYPKTNHILLLGTSKPYDTTTASSTGYTYKKITGNDIFLNKNEYYKQTTSNFNHEMVTQSNINNNSEIAIRKLKFKINTKKRPEHYDEKNQNIHFEDDIHKSPGIENYHEESTIKPTESMGPSPNSLHNNTVLKGLTPSIEKEDIWKLLSENADRKKLNSMIPEDRPTYLEVYRNGWRHEENEDYDMKYNIFDLL